MFTYRFKEVPGNILSMVLEVKGYDGVMKFWTPSELTAPNVTETMVDSVWIFNDMKGADSLYI
jgi:hypothetical protein